MKVQLTISKRALFEPVKVSELVAGDMFFTSKNARTYYVVSPGYRLPNLNFFCFRYDFHDKPFSYVNFRNVYDGDRVVYKIVELI